jgi:hypothetical protein
MRTTVTVKHYGKSDVEFEFLARVESAYNMLIITRKSNTEQETEGEFDQLRCKLYDFLSEKNISYDLRVEYFPGISDVFVSIKGFIDANKECTYSETDMRGELISGTVLHEIARHYEFDTYFMRLSSESDNYKQLKELMVFRGY